MDLKLVLAEVASTEVARTEVARNDDDASRASSSLDVASDIVFSSGHKPLDMSLFSERQVVTSERQVVTWHPPETVRESAAPKKSAAPAVVAPAAVTPAAVTSAVEKKGDIRPSRGLEYRTAVLEPKVLISYCKQDCVCGHPSIRLSGTGESWSIYCGAPTHLCKCRERREPGCTATGHNCVCGFSLDCPAIVHDCVCWQGPTFSNGLAKPPAEKKQWCKAESKKHQCVCKNSPQECRSSHHSWTGRLSHALRQFAQTHARNHVPQTYCCLIHRE